MIVKILRKSSTFKAVNYNTGKVDKNKGELLLVKNFGVLQGIENLRPQDYINYLEAVSSSNTRIKYPQFHVAISTKGRQHSKEELSDIAQKWMEGMGYGGQPYILIFHKDTNNNHVHLVSTRVGRDGKKISDRFEKLRAYRVLDQIMGVGEQQVLKNHLEEALSYNFSTHAQFMMLLETMGYSLDLTDKAYTISKNGHQIGSIDLSKIDNKIADRIKDTVRVKQIRAIFEKYRSIYDTSVNNSEHGYNSSFADFLRKKFGLEIVFHGKNGMPPYGYTLMDHSKYAVYRGSEIMALNDIITGKPNQSNKSQKEQTQTHILPNLRDSQDEAKKESHEEIQSEHWQNKWDNILPVETPTPEHAPPELEIVVPVLNINISDDIDDEAILGRNRRRKRKARTNTR
ncbi:relaxase/mobilization nuclease domain-containing protein [Sphingobacterium sp. ML3W]|uniref:relaxase/mobilization nuclease domain-containing protein n=1 Tax=Sphingobacterium sp. ML3W TaxID=1538644 RepID=UPI00249AFC26|nr:relaxase/mobilization nuclease domain-containing protein [Sphingobacterium sp. ML3W]WFA81394.1 relaxase/mobilization nuclease domain-containing protein [Sphingobacterium sp. ML3W]